MIDLELQKGAVLTSERAIDSGSQKPPEPDDPMQIRAEWVTGDQRVMLECLIEEFAHMGWDENRIAQMFENPFFLAAHGLRKRFGREAIRECIRQTLRRCGVMHCAISESKPTQRSQFVKINHANKNSASLLPQGEGQDEGA